LEQVKVLGEDGDGEKTKAFDLIWKNRGIEAKALRLALRSSKFSFIFQEALKFEIFFQPLNLHQIFSRSFNAVTPRAFPTQFSKNHQLSPTRFAEL
jgi:hypothetical protein